MKYKCYHYDQIAAGENFVARCINRIDLQAGKKPDLGSNLSPLSESERGTVLRFPVTVIFEKRHQMPWPKCYSECRRGGICRLVGLGPHGTHVP